MELMLVVTRLPAGESPPVSHRFAGGNLVAGSAAGCDLVLPGLADVSFAVTRNEDSRLLLTRKDQGLPVTIDGKKIEAVSIELKNGDTIGIPGYEILACVAFARSTQRTTTGLLSVVTGVLIALVIVAEILVATWLPQQIARREVWADELMRQQTINHLDALRFGIRSLGARDERNDAQQTLKLIMAEADRMAFFLRQNIDRMPIEQVQAMRNDIGQFHRLAETLLRQQLFPPPPTVNLAPAMETVLNEEAKKN